jgi:hypothetical protein
VLINFSPTAVLFKRRKILCPVCTVDESRPVMIEEGLEWAAHVKTKAHKRLAAKGKGSKRKKHSHLSVAATETGNGNKICTGDVISNAEGAATLPSMA